MKLLSGRRQKRLLCALERPAGSVNLQGNMRASVQRGEGASTATKNERELPLPHLIPPHLLSPTSDLVLPTFFPPPSLHRLLSTPCLLHIAPPSCSPAPPLATDWAHPSFLLHSEMHMSYPGCVGNRRERREGRGYARSDAHVGSLSWIQRSAAWIWWPTMCCASGSGEGACWIR